MKKVTYKGKFYDIPNFFEAMQILFALGVAFLIPFCIVNLIVRVAEKIATN